MDQKIVKQLEELQKAVTNISKNMATKDDLKQLKTDLIEEIKESEGFIVGSVDRNKAEKAVVEDINKRLTLIERKFAA